jgi:hypothetical protein
MPCTPKLCLDPYCGDCVIIRRLIVTLKQHLHQAGKLDYKGTKPSTHPVELPQGIIYFVLEDFA